jgi:hypothetical protein
MATTGASAPFTYRIDVDRGLVFLIYGNRQPTTSEWCAVMDALLGDAQYRAGMNLVSDRRHLVDAPTTGTLQQMASYVGRNAERIGTARWAIVTGTPAEYGMVRMGEVLFASAGSHIELRPFVDMDAALRWATTGEG